MRLRFLASLFLLAAANPALAQDTEAQTEPRWSLAIHGGAGTILRKNMTAAQQGEYEAALQSALDAGAAVLRDGGTAMDAVQAAIVPLEDDPKFNAGRGAVFTWDGENELDAAIMDGRDRSAGAVTGVKSVRNPILLAESVRSDGRHVFLSGEGAEEFARDNGFETTLPDWFATPARREALERLKARQVTVRDVDYKYGTVGAVALDQDGNMAAGTSTGGLTGKRWGRIGDAPMIGAGTYADNRACAVSATGAGEYFIRVGVAHEICARLRFIRSTGFPLMTDAPIPADERAALAELAADAVLSEVKQLGGDGGVIVVTPDGDALFSFNTPGMYRGRASSDGMNEVAIFAED
ncbi:MAG: isoaspartyl peptidase/L-asparaginase [Parerythrobacter sp.]